MKTLKKIVYIIVALAVAVISFINGSKELSNSKRLAAHGQSTTAEVVETQTKVSLRRGNSYFVVVEFQPKDAAKVHARLKVNRDIYDAAEKSGTVNVFYLPESPDICAAGNKVEPVYTNLIVGFVFIGIAAVLIFTFRTPENSEDAAKKIEANLKPMMETRHEYAIVNAADFPNLDLAFYDQTQKFLEGHGFTWLGDKENITLRKSAGLNIFIRVMVSQDKTIMAGIYHFKRKGLTGTKEARVLDLESWFNNGHFLTTSNAEQAGHFNSPPTIDACHLPNNTPQDQILQTHLNRFQAFVSRHPGVQPYGLATMEDTQNAQDELQRIKAEFRSRAGLSKAELERIAGGGSPAVDEVHAKLEERQNQQRANTR
jgi:Protein of unknown function (DUF3592)